MLRCFNSPFMCVISHFARAFCSHSDVCSYREGLSLAMQCAHAYADEVENMAKWDPVIYEGAHDEVNAVNFHALMFVYLHWVSAVRKGNADANELKSFIANGNDVLNVSVFARFTVAYIWLKYRYDERDSSKSLFSKIVAAFLDHLHN